jgi:hypothetical protein
MFTSSRGILLARLTQVLSNLFEIQASEAQHRLALSGFALRTLSRKEEVMADERKGYGYEEGGGKGGGGQQGGGSKQAFGGKQGGGSKQAFGGKQGGGSKQAFAGKQQGGGSKQAFGGK